MTDLSHQDALQFWADYDDQTVFRVVALMESIEDWTLDGDTSLEAAIDRLGHTLSTLDNVDVKDKVNLIKLCAYLKTSRSLRILQALDAAYPGGASKCLTRAEEISVTDEAAELFLRRNVVFERLRLLKRVLSDERINLLQKALEASHDT